MRITTGLLEYQIYLDYLQNGYEGDKGSVEAVQISIKALAQILRQKVGVFSSPHLAQRKQPRQLVSAEPIQKRWPCVTERI